MIKEPATDSLPSDLADEVRERWRDYLRACEQEGYSSIEDDRVLSDLPRVWSVSEFVARFCARMPAAFAELASSGELLGPPAEGWIAESVRTAVAGAEDEQAVMRALRRARNRHMVAIAWRDLSGAADTERTFADLSDLGDACIGAALSWVEDRLVERYGYPVSSADGRRQRLVVLGMGKLGGRELNFSSDIDLVFAYPEAGETDGRRSVDVQEFFSRAGQQLIRLLDQVTADGFVFRVDMRLRPFGQSGPLAASFSAFENYYQAHGREWERYAFIKARPVAGDLGAGEELLDMLRPFVYRRYLDYAVFESLREMKNGIVREVARRGMEQDIKLGRGGIREIEFIGQLFQLVRGGRQPELRQRSLLPVLHVAARLGLLDSDEARRLADDYLYLRKLENRLQMMRDEQLHQLPAEPADRQRLAVAMGESDWSGLAPRIESVRARVSEQFDEVFVGPRLGAREDESDTALARAWRNGAPEPEMQRALTEAGYADPAAVMKVLENLLQGTPAKRLGDRGRRRLDRLVPAVLEAAARVPAPETTLARVIRVLEAIASRTAYLALLVENPEALRHLTRLCSASNWIAGQVARHPLLLDELLDPRLFQAPPSASGYRRELADALGDTPSDDLEQRMDRLREFQQAAHLRVAIADLMDLMSVEAIGDHLSIIAELILDIVVDTARRHLTQRHGAPLVKTDDAPARFAVVAYGKLGSRELGYGSDLDLVFVHEEAPGNTQGPRSIDNNVFFSRLAQRIIHLLSTPTAAGVLYEVDTRLRPSGKAGLLVTGLEAFRQYQRERAWTWEHQALLRARPVAGDRALCEALAGIRREVLCRPRGTEELRHRVAAMRERIRKEKEATDSRVVAGGLTDVEFLAQYLVLAHAPEIPALVEESGTIPWLRALAAGGVLEEADAEVLIEAARDYRALVNHARLRGESPGALPDAAVRRVARIWDRLMEAAG